MNAPLRRYYRGHTLAAMRDVPAGSTGYYHFDHQGTTQVLADSTGTVTDQFSSDASGIQTKRVGNSINRNWYIGNLGYSRQATLSTYYLRARYLDVKRACFLSRDAVVALSGRAYAYAENSPALGSDPSGDLTIVPAPDLKPVPCGWGWSTGDNSECCGCRSCFYFYRLGKPAPRDAWLVQEIIRTQVVYNCNDTVKSKLTEHYWEAFPYKKGETRILDKNGREAPDSSVFLGDQISYGGQSTTGIAMVFSVQAIGKLLNWTPFETGLGRKTEDRPWFWPIAGVGWGDFWWEGMVMREGRSQWFCCVDCKIPKISHTTCTPALANSNRC